MSHLSHFARHLTEESAARAGTSSKQAHSNSAVKSKAFGELKNILLPLAHGAATPFASRTNNLKSSSLALQKTPSAKQKLKSSVKLPQQQQQQQQLPKSEQKAAAKSATLLDISLDEEHDAFDFPRNSCTVQCTKSDAQIWSEQNSFDDEYLNNLLANSYADLKNDDNVDMEMPVFMSENETDEMQLNALYDNGINEAANVNDLETPPYTDFNNDNFSLKDIMDLPF